MGIIDKFLQPFINKELSKQLDSKLKTGVKKVQASLGIEGSQNLYDITYGDFDNPYTQIDFTDSWVKFAEYKDIIYQTNLRYNKRAPFGAATVKTVVQFLSAWSVKDVTITAEYPENEEFIEDFCKQVKFEKFISELSVRGELQGHSLVKIVSQVVNGELTFKLINIPFGKYQYNLLFDDNLEFTGYSYKSTTGVNVTVDKKECDFIPVYGFDSDYTSGNGLYPIPSVGYVLEHCDAIDKGRQNMRETNRIFSKTTPVVSTEDQNTADTLIGQIESKDWNATSFLVAPKISMSKVGADNDGVDVIIKEILSNMQAISGTTGTPIDKLGFPEQFSSQSVRLENSESISVQCAQKRVAIKQGIESILAKCVDIYNQYYGKTLDPYGFNVTINESAMALQERKAVMLNDAYDRGVIDKQYYLENHPVIGDDANEILERLAEKEQADKEELNNRMNEAISNMPREKEDEQTPNPV